MEYIFEISLTLERRQKLHVFINEDITSISTKENEVLINTSRVLSSSELTTLEDRLENEGIVIKDYNSSRFMTSVLTDSTLKPLMDSIAGVNPVFEQRLSFACLNANFVVVNLIMGEALSGGLITSDNLDYFKAKLLSEEGIDLDNL